MRRLSKLTLKTNENLEPKRDLSLQKSSSTIQLRRVKHRNSKFFEMANNSQLLKQRPNNVEESQKMETLKFVYGKINYELERVTKHLKLIHKGTIYSILALGSPSQEYLKQKKIFLPEDANDNKKFLMLDLDQTLIHSVEQNQKFEVEINSQGDSIRFNVRPFCQMFLDTMSEHFQIYVFTSALQEYAEPIVNYLNSNKKYIKGLLSREHCMQSKNGLKIKDLRIIKNRDLSQIVMIDNMVHSFGLQLQNGIPILQFTQQKNDRELLGLQKILIQLKKAEDVRVYLRQKLGLKKCLEMPEDEFINVKPYKNFVIKKKTSYL